MISSSFYKKTIAGLTIAATLLSSNIALASSHREAPMIAGDPKVDATDLYAFVSPDNAKTVTLIANYIPFEEPAGGPNFFTFDDSAMYEINVDNNGDAKADVKYQLQFKTTTANPNTFLYNVGPISSVTDPNWNVKQTYTLTKIVNGVPTVIGKDLPTAPANIGPKSTPNYAALQAGAINTLPTGEKVFAGPVDDPFFAELGGIFDLVNVRKLPGNAGGGVDGLKGYNVHTIAIQVPITDLTMGNTMPKSATDTNAVIGVWTNAYRHATRVLNTNGTQDNSGSWVQVSRLGAPLVNEVVVPVGAKDLWNGSDPTADAQFANGVTDPELGKLLKGLFNVAVPPQGAFGTASARDDLVSVFLTGIPGLTKPANVVPAEELRLNVAIPPTVNPNRMGVIGGDTQGYPNGRRLTDDVVDISLQAVAGAVYPLFHPSFKPDPLATQLGDGVDANDVPFQSTFPYEALPHQGFDSAPHSQTAAQVTAGPMMSTGTTTGKPMICNISSDVSFGMRSDAVACLQKTLNVVSTGYFGNLTKAAVTAWQKSAGLPQTGVFDAATRAALNAQ